MKAKALLYAAVVAAVSLSCTREAEESGLLNSGIEMEFTAEWADEKGADSRTILQEDGTSIWWSANEEINVFFGTGSSGRFVSTNTEPKPVVSFYGTLNTIIGGMETEGDKPVYWAVYPYSSTNTCDGQSVTLTVPLDQTGTKGTFADKFFPAVACGDSYSLAFYNVCGGARFSVTQEGVTKVIFKSNNGSPMAGKVKVGFGDDDKPQILEVTEPVDSIVVNAPEGGFIPGENYFAAMLPQMHAEGLTVILKQKGKKAEKTLQSNIEIKRSTFGTLNNIDEGVEYVKDESEPEVNPDDAIQFEDPIAKYACVEKFDTNGDGEVSYAEAAAVTSLNGLFTDWNTVTLFDEIRFFTGVSSTQNVFTGLKNLKHITIPDNITSLGNFQNCTALDTVVLPAALNALPAYCFDGCTALKSVTLPMEISAIPNYAFRNCSSLETLAIPSTITSIGQYAFSGCTVLAGIDLPYGLKTIGDYAFENCQAIALLDFPASLSSIGRYAYAGCCALTTVCMGNDISLGWRAFSCCTGLETASIGNGASVGGGAFYGCTALKTVVLPEDMTTIPSDCFYNCTFLTNITWPIALIDIESYAFFGCVISENDLLASKMELPSSVKKIGSHAFWGIRHLIMPSASAINIASDSFVRGDTRLYVPTGMVEMYKVRTNWNNYKDQIYPISDYPVTSVYAEPEAVDLGLSVKWASFNLGATAPEEYGDYFAWGEIGVKEDYSASTYKWMINGSYLTKYCTASYYGYNGFMDNKTVLDFIDDAAAATLGGSWRMATDNEWRELMVNCTWMWSTLNGINGYKVTSRKTGYTDKWIFLPAASIRQGTSSFGANSNGYYWSSSLTSHPSFAYYLEFYSSEIFMRENMRLRCDGFSVRPVYYIPLSSISLNKSQSTIISGRLERLVATFYPSEATNKNVMWSSSDTRIAAVDANGLVTGRSSGTAVITATTQDGGFTAECIVKVAPYEALIPELVDLGLSIKWASFNLGASAPEEYGVYFAWGEAETKDEYSLSTYKFEIGTDYEGPFSKYVTSSSYGTVDNKTALEREDDAATVALGGCWRMATYDEWDELKTNCTWEWTKHNGVEGIKVTSKKIGYTDKWIFLPAAGYRYDTDLSFAGSCGGYWSSSLNTGYPYSAYSVYFNSDRVFFSSSIRSHGKSVRPVSE